MDTNKYEYQELTLALYAVVLLNMALLFRNVPLLMAALKASAEDYPFRTAMIVFTSTLIVLQVSTTTINELKKALCYA